MYAEFIRDSLQLQDKWVLDVGCACGAITCGMRRSRVLAMGVDLSEFMIGLGRQHFPEVPLYVMDAVNLHAFDDHSFDAVHMQQTLEHMRPELVPFVLRELRRVTKPGGILVSFHATIDEYLRQGRIPDAASLPADHDPTHLSFWRQSQWLDACAKAGWKYDRELWSALESHENRMLPSTDWDGIVARRD
jgi:ubiquinone/menaquinone biosynthesis C-methylase UbiE